MGFIDKKKAQAKQAVKKKAKSVASNAAQGVINKAKGKHYCPKSSNGKHQVTRHNIDGYKVLACKHCNQLH